jgi:hypothetical protein
MATENEQAKTPGKQATKSAAKKTPRKSATTDSATADMGTTELGTAGTTGAAAEGGARKQRGAAKKTAGGAAKQTGAAKKAGAPKKTTAGAAKKTGGAKRGAPRSKPSELQSALHQFAAAHPDGWGHDQWLNLVRRLEEQGLDTTDRDSIGMMLENERMRLHLERIEGLRPKQVNSLIEQYGTMWNLRQANPEQVASLPGVSSDVAERVVEAAR